MLYVYTNFCSGYTTTPSAHCPHLVFSYLANLEPKHLLEVCGLADEKQVESPASAKICHNDGVHWHGCEESPPRGVEFLQHMNKCDCVVVVVVIIAILYQ